MHQACLTTIYLLLISNQPANPQAMVLRHKQARQRSRHSAGWLAMGLALSIVAFQVSFAGQADTAGLHPTHLKVVSSTALFVGVNHAELLSSSKLWVKTIGKREGLSIVDPEVVLVDNVNEMRAQVDSGSVDLVISSSLEYLALNRSRVLTPQVTLTSSSTDGGKLSYLILVNRENKIDNIAALKGKSINTYSRSASRLNRLWLDVLLNEAHLPSADSFFGNITPSLKPSTACLPIFFGKSDACLIDSSSWETLRELNPQLATKLTVLTQSQPFVESLISITANKRDYRAETIHALHTLQDDAEGRQVLLLFKCSRAAGITAADLNAVAELRSTYLRNTRPADRKVDLPTAGSGSAGLEAPKAP